MPFENIVVISMLPFPTMFSRLSKTEIIILTNLNLLSANALSLDQCRILLFGKELRVKQIILIFWYSLSFCCVLFDFNLAWLFLCLHIHRSGAYSFWPVRLSLHPFVYRQKFLIGKT